MAKKIFEVEISSGGPKSYKTSAVLTMPCTQAEFRDSLQKARIQDIRTCSNELTRVTYPGITSDMVGQNVDLLELNLLAIRLTMLGEDDRMGLDGLLQVEKENRGSPIPLSRLINLTFNADICLLAPQVSNTQELGALLYEGEMLSDEAMALLDTTEEGGDFRKQLLEVLGEHHQKEHDGVFTSWGYAEPGADFKEVYQKGEMFCFVRSSAPVVLEVRKGFFDDPSYDNDKTTILNLPASDADIWRAVGEVDAASLDECAFRCIDCEIPSLRDAVDDAIEQEGGIGMASEFATNLAQKKQSWHEADWVKYKALLSVAGHPHLQDAIQLMRGLDAYELRPDVAATWDYAELILRDAGQCDVEGWTDIVSIAAGGCLSFGVKADGTVVVAGDFQEDVDDDYLNSPDEEFEFPKGEVSLDDEEGLWEPEELGEFSLRTNVPPDSGEPVILAESFFVLTGSFTHCGGDERQIQALIEAKGGHCRPSVSGKTNYLVLGSKGDWGDNKRIEARRQMELGSDIRIIWEDALFDSLGDWESDSAALAQAQTRDRAERYERFLSSMPSKPFRNEDGSFSTLSYPYDTPSEIRFAGKTFCTGLMYFTEQYRNLTQQIEDRGGRCTFQVSGRTDYGQSPSLESSSLGS